MTDIELDLDEIVSRLNSGSVLPDPEALLFYRMYKERKIWIDIQVDASMMEYIRMIMLWNMEDKGIPPEERKPIWIYLENFGGDGDFMWAMVDAMCASVTPIVTVNMGCAASAASLIFISGSKRYMMPNANVVIHEGSASMSGDAVKVIDQTENYKRDLMRMKNFILDHTKIPKRELNKKRNNDWFLDASYCLEHGVCDTVVESINEII